MSDDTIKPATVADTVPAATASAPAELPHVEPGSYELREELGAGGMGKVVVARDRRLGRLLAVKVAQTTDASARARFTREAVLTARLQHPSIIPVHEAGVWPGDEPFYAMKLVAGASLARLIARTTNLDERLALIPHVIAVVDALAYAHAQRVIHRDLKPDNVIVGEYGETIVIDWGLAKELDSDEAEPAGPYRRFDGGRTVQGAAMGTPPYMAPEQAAGEPVDERADVYGLGAMLYHVLSGVAPYAGSDAEAVMERVLAGPPMPLAERQDGIPAPLLAIVDKAMAREPADRYANAKQLADDLKRFERGQLVAAHEYSRRELVWRWLLRHRAMAAVIVALLVAAGVWLRAELHDRAARGQRLVELLHADDTDHAVAREQLARGEFGATAATLRREVDHLRGHDEAELVARLGERQAELERVDRLAAFYDHARKATFLTGDEDHGEDAIYELTAALREVGALAGDGRAVQRAWWDGLFPAELVAAQRRDLELQAYRLLLDLAIMHLKQGGLLLGLEVMVRLPNPDASAHFRACLDVLAATPALERALAIRPAEIVWIWQAMAIELLHRVGSDQDKAAAAAVPRAKPTADGADNPDDHAFLGVGHLLVAQTITTPKGKALADVFAGLFDYAHPRDRAEWELRTAVRIDPTQYWPHFMLALALRDRGDFDGAELELDTCIQLEPDVMLAYGQRSLILVERAEHEADPQRKAETMARALADSQATLTREPAHPVTYWVRGDLMRRLDRRADAIAAYLRALELEDHVLEKFSRQVAIDDVTTYVERALDPSDADGHALLAFLALASSKPGAAIERAGEALQIQPEHARALAIRGTALLAQQQLEAARRDLDAALVRAPDNALAAQSRARLLESGPDHAAALAAYDTALRVSVVREHQAQAQLGRYRMLTALGRNADAATALAAAKQLVPARTLP